MSGMSNYLESQIRKHLFRTGSFVKPAVIAVALCTVAPTDASTGATLTEPPEADGYSRATLNPLDANWSAPDATGGVTRNQAALDFGSVENNNWDEVTHFAIVDDATVGAGNVLIWGSVLTPRTPLVGNPVSFDVDALAIMFE